MTIIVINVIFIIIITSSTSTTTITTIFVIIITIIIKQGLRGALAVAPDLAQLAVVGLVCVLELMLD